MDFVKGSELLGVVQTEVLPTSMQLMISKRSFLWPIQHTPWFNMKNLLHDFPASGRRAVKAQPHAAPKTVAFLFTGSWKICVLNLSGVQIKSQPNLPEITSEER